MTQFAASTHPGLQRGHNEDCFVSDPGLGLWLVADGVGGQSSGEVASAIVRDTVQSEFRGGKGLIDAICDSHQAVLAAMLGQEATAGMGSTVVALALRGHHFDVAWVGDSRAYLWDGELHQLTRDHSQVAALVERGIVSAEEAITHPKRHVLTQSVGVSATMRLLPERVEGTLGTGQQILLCSDGLTDELSDATIAGHMRRYRSPQAQVDALLSAALAAGGRDNITVVVVSHATDSTQTGFVDLEATQDVGRNVHNQNPRRINHGAKVWIILAAMFALVFAIWL